MDFNLTNNILKKNNNEIAIFIHEKLRVSVLEKCKDIKSNYFKKYIFRIFKNKETITKEILKYKRIINIMNMKNKGDSFLNIDLGGCHGFLSYLLTKYTNNDVMMLEPFEESTKNSKIIWSEFNKRISFVNGDYKTINAFLENNQSKIISNILSYDVFEHVGNIEEFIRLEEKISKYNNTKFIHASSANPYNIRNKLRDIKLQLKYEYFGNKNKLMKSTSTKSSYFLIRFRKYEEYSKNIYKNKFFRIIRGIIFSFLTRGLTKEEFNNFLSKKFHFLLKNYIRNFNKIGFFNTIDINNNSWMERHHNLNYIKYKLRSSNFKKIEILPTKYVYTNKNFSALIKIILNKLIEKLPHNKLKLLLSPEFVITYSK